MQKEVISEITEIINRADNVKSFRLNVMEEGIFKAGQFMFISFDGTKELGRYLSFSNSPTEKGYIEFTKKITNSEFSQKLDTIKVGEFLKVKYPFGDFIFHEEYKKIVFLSGGIGITPIRSICRDICDTGKDTDMALLYGNRSVNDIAFKDDFDLMQRVKHDFKVIHILSQPESDWEGRTGFIDAQKIKEEVPDYHGRKFYVCGPPLMVFRMKSILKEELKLTDEHIITENFIGYWQNKFP